MRSAAPLPATLTVMRSGDGWGVVSEDGRSRGRFRYQIDAEEAALRMAQDWRRRGSLVEVLVQTRSGEVKPLAFA